MFCDTVYVCVGEQITKFEHDKEELQDRLSAESQKCKTFSHLVHKLEIELREHVTGEPSRSMTNESTAREEGYVCVSMCVCARWCSYCVICFLSFMYTVRPITHSGSKSCLNPAFSVLCAWYDMGKYS